MIICLQVSVFAHYWILNNAGIPLIFKQESSSNDAPGNKLLNNICQYTIYNINQIVP